MLPPTVEEIQIRITASCYSCTTKHLLLHVTVVLYGGILREYSHGHQFELQHGTQLS